MGVQEPELHTKAISGKLWISDYTVVILDKDQRGS